MHLACQSLRSGECTLALAGGVTVLATPGMFIEFSRQRGLAPDGRCKPFAAAADGTAWAEGAGLLLLERLSDARRNSHPVLAVIRGCAVNSDGASNGLTAPNGPSQDRVIRAGPGRRPAWPPPTSTPSRPTAPAPPSATPSRPRPSSPPTARPRPRRPPARRLAQIQHRPHPGRRRRRRHHQDDHGHRPRPPAPDPARRRPHPPRRLAADTVALLTEPAPWPDPGRPRRAAVSSFGISGTNAHLILEQPPAPDAHPDAPAPAPDDGADGPWPWPLSARTPAALRAAAARLRAHPAARRPRAAGRALAATRATFDHRAVITAADPDAYAAALDALAAGRPHPALAAGTAPGRPRTAYMLAGQGSQRPQMGRALHTRHPAYARALDAACDHLAPHLGRPLQDILFADPGTPQAALLNQTAWTQAALFATETALYRLLEHLGATPDYLIGHSIGELTAAHLAGTLTLPDAAALVAARGTLMQAARADGAMHVVRAPEKDVLASLDARGGHVAIAAVNSPNPPSSPATRRRCERWQTTGRPRGTGYARSR